VNVMANSKIGVIVFSALLLLEMVVATLLSECAPLSTIPDTQFDSNQIGAVLGPKWHYICKLTSCL
jgi:hypothetical protein